MAGGNGHNGQNGNGRHKLPSEKGDYEVGHCKPPKEYQFKPGWKGGPGRPSAGASVREWYNIMAEWTEAKIRVAAQDEKAPTAKRAAAERWLAAMARGDDLDRICDQTAGKPAQSLVLSGRVDHAAVVHEGMARLWNDPEAAREALKLNERLYGNPGKN